ncbi:hypothetical protein ABLA30_03330 [Xenorhabdus nematophila]|uniref:hypothetical protein n=1 Tax=Xenorhabdus nematophila TaxID=628 RepID=UPI0003275AE5|nr:hypothetical protein [Xenorhabdus nematophila]CCW30105.1 conserved hypothetical protein [Xenorhabdus nematophila F1]
MIDTLEKLRSSLIAISFEEEIKSQMNIDADLSENYEGYLVDFANSVELLSKTVSANDQISTQCALTRVRMASLNLVNFYQDVIDDVVLINQQDSWPEIPEGYKLPEYYNCSSDK